MIIALGIIALALVAGIIVQRYTLSRTKKALSESNEIAKITFELLWDQIRDHNQLTFSDTFQLIKAMTEIPSYMPQAKEALALRVTGKDRKRIGF